MRIQHNIMALNSNRQLGVNNSAVSKSLEKLSSGLELTEQVMTPQDWLFLKMRAQIKGLEAGN